MLGGLAMKKKMGGLGKLSQFSGIKQKEEEVKSQESELKIESKVQEIHLPPIQNPSPPTPPSEGGKSKIQNQEKLVTVNIKVTKSQRDWLAETASQVRDNNSEPVPSKERVYPQHLIGVAIELLRSTDLDWSQVKNVGDLHEQLNL
jgi:hypothetical protein